MLNTIFQFGVEFAESDTEKRKIILTNTLSILCVLMTLFPALFLYWFDLKLIAFTAFGLSILYSFLPFLNKLGYIYASRLFLLTIANIAVLIYSIILGRNSGVQLFFFLALCFPFVCFQLHLRKHIGYGVILSVAFILLNELFQVFISVPQLLPVAAMKILYYSILVSVISSLLVTILTFYKSQVSAEKSVRKLKDEQDGDYFLTNLIMRPLFKNFNKSEQVETNFLIHQKKQFSFKNNESELGGDICITGNLKFYGRRHTLFVNADAMGKSMQGAGGAIVFGTTMNNILSRSASNKKNLIIDPAQWLEDTYNELHGCFLAFDGSMLISCVVGLIDDHSGKMYYFNAEHPHTVLYRDGVATFLDADSETLRKLGSQISCEFRLTEFQLKPNDILLIGSDGRDDLILNDSGEMNFDENLFLNTVKMANANIDTIFQLSLKLGEVKDDFSLMKVEFIGQSKESILPPDNSHIVHLLKNKKFDEVVEILGGWPPEEKDKSLHFFQAYALLQIGLGTAAAKLLRKNLEKNPNHINSIILLSKIEKKAGHFEKSERLIKQAMSLKPTDPRIAKLLK